MILGHIVILYVVIASLYLRVGDLERKTKKMRNSEVKDDLDCH